MRIPGGQSAAWLAVKSSVSGSQPIETCGFIDFHFAKDNPLIRRPEIVVATLSLLTLFSGCSDSGPVADIVETVSASGTLTYQGKALPGYQVSFQPVSGERPATAISDAEGKFALGTNDLGDGAAPGSHKVTVVWTAPSDDGMGEIIDDPSKLPKAPVEIPAKYHAVETSGLQLEIPPGGTSDLRVELE